MFFVGTVVEGCVVELVPNSSLPVVLFRVFAARSFNRVVFTLCDEPWG